MVRVLRSALVLGVLAAVMVVAPVPASAHEELTATSPVDGSTVTTRVTEVTLSFSGPVRADGSTVTVTGPDGRTHSSAAVSVVDTVVHQPVAPLSSGAYRVEWRVIAGDGDPMSGQFSFTLALPPELEPTTAAPTNAAPATAPPSTPEPRSPSVADGGRGSGASPWWWLLAALVVVGVLAAAVVVSRRRGRTG
jgi:methionine-rich copper-binding protein CopC